jgi:3-oxoacyl-[acyl-carrier protein] reductase
VARGREQLDRTCSEIREGGGRVVGVVGDVTDAADADRSLGEAIRGLGGVDVLVNSATASAPGGFDEITDEQWTEGFAVKPLGFARAARAVLPPMRAAGRGRIVNICGSGGRYVTTGYLLGGLNAATLHFTKLLAEAEARHGISVIAVNPGPIETERVHTFLDHEAAQLGVDVDEHKAAAFARLPLGRMPTASEVAKVIVMFCSDLTEYCSGAAVQMDGLTVPGLF